MSSSRHIRAAVVVGIDRYPSPNTPLAGAVADARDIARCLERSFGFERDAIELLTDEQATHDAIESALTALAERVADGGIALFYFAGHGDRQYDDSGDEADGWDELLVPVDDGGAGPRISDDRLRSHVEQLCARAATTVVILDCCHAGTAVDGAGDTAARPGGQASPQGFGLRALGSDLPYVLIAATSARNRAFEREHTDDTTRGLLTRALVEALDAAAPGATWTSVMATVTARVVEAETWQRPQVEGGARDRHLFAPTASRPWAHAVSSLDGVSVKLGRLHGIAAGDLIALCPLDAEAPRWLTRVDEVDWTTSTCPLPPVAELRGTRLRARLVGPPRRLWDLARAASAPRPQSATGALLSVEVEPPLDAKGRRQVSSGERVTLGVHNHTTDRLFLTLVALDESDRPTILLPDPGGELALDPGLAHHPVIEAALPPGTKATRHRLVFVATLEPVDLRPIEDWLPADTLRPHEPKTPFAAAPPGPPTPIVHRVGELHITPRAA